MGARGPRSGGGRRPERASRSAVPDGVAPGLPVRRPTARFHSVAVLASDLDRSLAWYTGPLELDVLEHDGHGVTVGRTGENGAIHLGQMTGIDPSSPPEPGNTGIQLDLEGEFRTACAALAANGVRFSRLPLKRPWGWYALIVDPDDNEIRLNPA